MVDTQKKVFSVYVELLIKGDEIVSVSESSYQLLSETYGAENVNIIEVNELTEDEVIELETDIHNDTILDEMDIKRDEEASDELGG